MKKLLLIIFGILLCLPFVMGATLCDDDVTGNVNNADFYGVNVSQYQYLSTIASDEKYEGITNITPRTSFTITELEEEEITALSGSTSTLIFKNINSTGGISVYNASEVMGTGNYTVNYTTGVITWGTMTSKWNNTLVNVMYNKTFERGLDNLVSPLTATLNTDLGQLYDISPSSPSYGNQVSWSLADVTGTGSVPFENKDWSVQWTYTTGDCTSQVSCTGTKGVIFAGFALLAVAAIVLAAFGIINLFNGGDMGTAAMGAIVIGVIGLGIVLMVGYFIIGNLGFLVCS